MKKDLLFSIFFDNFKTSGPILKVHSPLESNVISEYQGYFIEKIEVPAKIVTKKSKINFIIPIAMNIAKVQQIIDMLKNLSGG